VEDCKKLFSLWGKRKDNQIAQPTYFAQSVS
jgi:hypothetical protein